jgi:glucan phosphoethanolaminetransferase (alkaline phosphatase superfamily)
MNFNAFNRFIVKLFTLYILGIVMFTIARIVLMLNFGKYQEFKPFLADVFRAYHIGVRYDTVVLTYGLVLPVLISILILILSPRFQFINRFANRFLFFYTLILYFIFFWILIVDFYFYKFFQSHINLLAFGIVKDDTGAVFHSVWTDYPVIRILLGAMVFFIFLRLTIKKITHLSWEVPIHKLWAKTAIIAMFFLLYGIGMRGSLGIFPLEKDDAVISANSFINTLTMNGVFSLKDALTDNSNFDIDADAQKTMSKYGFTDPTQAVSSYLGEDIGNISPENALIDTTTENDFLKQQPLNVVFIMMESMSNYYLDLQSPTLNVLGTLENMLPDCYLFRNFLSGRNGTIHSLEGLMISSPLTPVSQSKYLGVSFESSVALPFKKNGYETSFVTCAKLGWRNLDKFVARQYFHRTEGSASLLAEVPNAKACEWGVFDEFMFKRIEQLLKSSNGKPQFIFGFSTTNHTPYQLPETSDFLIPTCQLL